MSQSTLLILFVVSILVSVIVAKKTNVNLGIPAWACAYIIGCWCMDMKVKEVVACWPTSTVFQLMSVCIMFAFANQNGTIKKLSGKLLYAFRKNVWAINIILYFVGFLLAALGPQSATINAIMCSVGFVIALETGLHPIALGAAICHGAGAGSQLPWSGQGVVVNGIVGEYFPDEALKYTWILFLAFFIVSLAVTVLGTLLTGSFKVNAASIEKPEPMDKTQKTTLAIMLVIVIMAVIPSTLGLFVSSKLLKTLSSRFDIQALAFFGVLLMTALKLGDCKQAITKGVPWNTLVLIGGMCTLVGVAQKGGVTDLLAAWLSGSVPSLLLAPALCVVAGIMSLFTGAMSAVFPLLTAVAVPLAAASGMPAWLLISAVICGARITACSPFSTGGSLIMGYNTIESWNENNKLFNSLMILAFGGLLLPTILSLVLSLFCR